MKKWLSFLLVVCLMMPFASFAEEPIAEEGAELTIMGGAHLVSVTEIVLKDFMAAHPEIKINFEKYSYAEYPIKMRTQMSMEEPTPDVLLVHDAFIRQFVDAGYLLPLDDMIDRSEYLDVFSVVEKDGNTYGLPNQCSNQFVFIYRKDVYEKLNLTPPTTFDEYFQQALTLKENGYYAGAYDPAVSPEAYYFEPFMYMLGGTEIDSDGKIVMDKAKEALTLVKQCYDAGIWHCSEQGNSQTFWTAFNEGKIACMPSDACHVAYYDSNTDPSGKAYGNMGVASIFTFGENLPKSIIGNIEYFAINAKTRYPNAAKILLKYLCQSEEASMKFADVNENGVMARYANGYLPGIEKIINEGGSGSPVYGNEQIVPWLAKNLMETKPQVPLVDARTTELRRIVDEVIAEMLLNGTYTVDTAVEEILFQAEML